MLTIYDIDTYCVILTHFQRIVSEFVCMCVCLFRLHAKTAGPISMKFGIEVADTFHKHFYQTSLREGDVCTALSDI